MKFSLFKKKGPSAKDLYIQGLNLLLEGRSTEALSHFIESATLDSDNAAAYYHVGNIFRSRGSLGRAEKIHTELLKRFNLPWELKVKIKVSLARTALSTQNRARAEELIQQVAAEDGRAAWIKEDLLSLYEKAGQWQEAINLKLELDKIKGLSEPKKLALYYLENGSAQVKDNGRAARIQFKEAIKLNPLLPWPYILIADSYFRENRVDDALEFWSKLFDAVPSKAYLIFDKIETYYYSAGEYGEVGRIYRRLADTEPENVNALLALSRYLYKKGSREEALYYCRRVLELKPDSREASAELLRQTLDSVKSVDEIRENVERLMRLCPSGRSFVCRSCHKGAEEPHWRCRHCNAWDPFGLS
jgi:lipopolysaccharide assembly protein B